MYTCAWYIWSSSVSTHRTWEYDQNTACSVIEMEKRPTFFRWCLHLRQPSLDFLWVFRSLNPVACSSGGVVSPAILSTPLDFVNQDIGTKGGIRAYKARCLQAGLPCLLTNPWAGPIRETFFEAENALAPRMMTLPTSISTNVRRLFVGGKLFAPSNSKSCPNLGLAYSDSRWHSLRQASLPPPRILPDLPRTTSKYVLQRTHLNSVQSGLSSISCLSIIIDNERYRVHQHQQLYINAESMSQTQSKGVLRILDQDVIEEVLVLLIRTWNIPFSLVECRIRELYYHSTCFSS
jgi:hypothetical protein